MLGPRLNFFTDVRSESSIITDVRSESLVITDVRSECKCELSYLTSVNMNSHTSHHPSSHVRCEV